MKPLLVLGTERALARRAVDDAAKAFLKVFPEGTVDRLAYAPGAGDEASLAYRSSGFFSAARMVLVWDYDERQDTGSDREALTVLVKHPAEDRALVVYAPSLDRRGKLFKAFRSGGTIHQAEPMKVPAAQAFCVQAAKAGGLEMAPQAASELVSVVGTDGATLEGEVAKLALYVYPKKTARKEDVRAISEAEGRLQVFALTDALSERRLGGALDALAELLHHGEPGPKLVALMARELRLLGQVRSGQALKGVHPYVAQKIERRVGAWTLDDVGRGLKLLLEADQKIKGGAPEGPVLSLALVSLLRPEVPKRRGIS